MPAETVSSNKANEVSIFDRRSLKEIYREIQEVYSADSRPWVVGYSGGKDSTATLQLIWYAISKLPPNNAETGTKLRSGIR